MSRNFFVLLKYSFLDKVKTKSFVVLSVVLVVLSAIATFGPVVYENYFAGSNDDHLETIGIINEDGAKIEGFSNSLAKYNSAIEVEETDLVSEFSEEYEFVVNLDTNEIIIYEDDLYDLDDYYYLIQLALTDSALAEDVDSFAVTTIENDGQLISNEAVYGITYVYKFLMYLVTLLLASLIANEILEEKSTRAMEVIISSIKPTEHMLAKILSGILFMVSLLAVLILSNAVLITIANIVFDDPTIILLELIKSLKIVIEVDNIVPILLYILVMFFVTLFIISTIAATISSVFTSTSEAQAAVQIITIIIIAGFIFSIMVTDIAILKIGLYIPVINFFVVADLLFTGGASLIELGISMVISILTLCLIIHFGSKVYRYGVLNYSKKGLKEAMKNAFKK